MKWLVNLLSVSLVFKVVAIILPRRVAAAREFLRSCTTDFYCSTLTSAPEHIRPLLHKQFKRALPSVERVTLSRKRIHPTSYFTEAQRQDFFTHDKYHHHQEHERRPLPRFKNKANATRSASAISLSHSLPKYTR